MPDPAQQLQRLHEAGFEFQTFARFPNAVGVIRGHCIVLLAPTPEGLKPLGTPGWRMGEVLGVLTTAQGRQVFQAKSETVEATPENLQELSKFRDEVEQILRQLRWDWFILNFNIISVIGHSALLRACVDVVELSFSSATLSPPNHPTVLPKHSIPCTSAGSTSQRPDLEK